MRKNICSPSCLDIPIEECYEEVLGEKYESKCLVNESKSKVSPKVNESKSKVIPKVSLGKSNSYICRYCNNEYTHKQSRYKHEKTCTEKGAYTEDEVAEKVAEATAEATAEANANKDQIIAEKDKLVLELKTQNANLLQKVGNNNTTNNNTINIHLKAFGQENLSYITPEFIKDLIRYNLFSAIPKLLKEIHFNPDHTENRNTLVPSRKDTLAKTYNGDKWNFTTKDEVFEDMTDKAFNKLTEYGSGPKFEKFYDAYDDQDTGYLKKIKKQTEIMILNNQ